MRMANTVMAFPAQILLQRKREDTLRHLEENCRREILVQVLLTQPPRWVRYQCADLGVR